MTWDGIPEHRNLRGDDEQVPDLSPGASAARFLAGAEARAEAERQWRQRLEEQHRIGMAGLGSGMRPEQAREVMRRFRHPQPEPDPVPAMPADPFSGAAIGSIAQAEMVESLIEGGWPEHRACYYVACLVSVSLAMQRSGMMDRMPPWPQNPMDEP